jgi:hypothetical protein
VWKWVKFYILLLVILYELLVLTQSVYCELRKHPSTANNSFEVHLEITIHTQNAQWQISLIWWVKTWTLRHVLFHWVKLVCLSPLVIWDSYIFFVGSLWIREKLQNNVVFIWSHILRNIYHIQLWTMRSYFENLMEHFLF